MANTTFTGNVRQNGDGNRTSVAGSVEVCAQFHIADFQTAGVRSATKSSTNLTDVLIPKNALISKVQVTCTNAGAANTFDLGLVGVVAGVLDADAFEYFLEEGIFNKEVATKFKENVLSKGGTVKPMELYKRFRGQEPKPEALLRRAGLI